MGWGQAGRGSRFMDSDCAWFGRPVSWYGSHPPYRSGCGGATNLIVGSGGAWVRSCWSRSTAGPWGPCWTALGLPAGSVGSDTQCLPVLVYAPVAMTAVGCGGVAVGTAHALCSVIPGVGCIPVAAESGCRQWRCCRGGEGMVDAIVSEMRVDGLWDVEVEDGVRNGGVDGVNILRAVWVGRWSEEGTVVGAW